MFETVQLLSLAAAVVIDTALLLALADRWNRRLVRVPLLLLIAGVWLWHAGLLALVLALALSGPAAHAVQLSCLLAACAGALLMPCAMSHALVRLRRTGLELLDCPDPRHLFAYLPMLAIIPIASRLTPPPPGDLLASVLPLVVPYLAWAETVNVAAGLTFLRLGRRVDFIPGRPFFAALGWLSLARTVLNLVVFLVVSDAWPEWGPAARLAGILSPLLSVLLLAYFVVRHNFLQLSVDRTVVYAGVIVGLLLAHQLVLLDISAGLAAGWHAPLVFLEGAAMAALVVLYPPLRRRCAESLRYLLGAWVAERRERLRWLAMQMSAQAGRPAAELVIWFGDALRQALDVDFVAGWLFRFDGTCRLRWGESGRLGDDAARRLQQHLSAAGQVRCTPHDAPDSVAQTCLQTAGASLAVVKTHQGMAGLLLIGKHSRNRELSDEAVSAVVLLVEQLAVTLEKGALEAERREAERRAAQAERLSELGLLASSIAHEVKNPLSAIKTIAAVLAEDLGPDSPHAEDIRIILGEIDRLAATTTQLLDFARPHAASGRPGCIASVLAGAVRVLRHLARQRHVALECRLADNLPPVGADDEALREIFFNLMSNALDAAGPGGQVVVTCSADGCGVVAEVHDSGAGIPPEIQAQLFEPFVTSKERGTGLGLYAVGRRVRELGGEIACTSDEGRGTVFRVRLPSVLRTAAKQLM
jgi:signal transduction histidine kinase